MDFQVAIIGAGPAGLMAAITAAERGRNCVLIEKNRKVGVKILISGGTRCNLTHDTDARGIIAAFGKEGRFLHSALSQFSPEDALRFFHQEGVPTKREPNGKIFPASDKALHVQQAMFQRLQRSGCQLANQQSVQQISTCESGYRIVTDQQSFHTQTVILATGGLSYAGCGTTGDGYPWLEQLGHHVTPRFPALVPLCIVEPGLKQLTGIALEDCAIRVVNTEVLEKASDPDSRWAIARKKTLMERRAPLLFTHKGLSGPAPMDVSRIVSSSDAPQQLRLLLDLLPDLDWQHGRNLLEEAIQTSGSRTLIRWLQQDLMVDQNIAERLITYALEAHEVPPSQKLAELNRKQIGGALAALKMLPVTPWDTLGYPKAEVTMGGVALDEVNPRTMESKKSPGLYLAGEILNLDGWIGGFNFQSAFSTGYVAGRNA